MKKREKQRIFTDWHGFGGVVMNKNKNCQSVDDYPDKEMIVLIPAIDFVKNHFYIDINRTRHGIPSGTAPGRVVLFIKNRQVIVWSEVHCFKNMKRIWK